MKMDSHLSNMQRNFHRNLTLSYAPGSGAQPPDIWPARLG